MPTEIQSSSHQVQAHSLSVSRSSTTVTSQDEGQLLQGGEEENPGNLTPVGNSYLGNGEASVPDAWSSLDYLACIGSFLWTKLQTTIERWIIAAMERWNRTWASTFAEMMAGSTTQTAIMPQESVRHYPSSEGPSVPSPYPDVGGLDPGVMASKNPETYISTAYDMAGPVGGGWDHVRDSGIGSSDSNGRFIQQSSPD
jgi:hypothetical protein